MPARFVVATMAAVITACALGQNASAAPVPRDFIGITAEDVFAGDPGYRDANLSAQSALGIGTLRQTFDWAQIERAPGRYDLSYHDTYVLTAASHGITVLPILFHPPAFYAGRSRGKAACAPASNAPFAAYAQALVRRYGAGGTLWAEHPEVSPLPIRAWQIWNEPNLRVYWCDKPNARQYVAMLRAVGGAIKQLDSGAQIVTAGLPDSKLSGTVPQSRFIDQMYAAKAARYFDALAINSYARDERELSRMLTSIRRRMDAHGDRRGQIWITEIGWGDRGPKHRYVVGARGQAKRIAASLALIRRQRIRLGIRGFVYFCWRDAPPYAPDFKDMWGLHTGLLDINGQPKPALDVFGLGLKGLR